jgi:hypothetical protein
LLIHTGSLITDFATQVDLRVVEVPTSKGSKVTPSNRDEQSTIATTMMHRQSSSCTDFVGLHELLDPSDNLNTSSRRRSFGGSTSYELGIFCKHNFLSWRRNSKDLDVNKKNMVGGDKKKSKRQKVTFPPMI